MTDLITHLQSDGYSMTHVSSSNGGEWHGRCPFCQKDSGDGGTDRFVVWPGKGDCGAYFCRRNPLHKGDGIEYLRTYRGLGFAAACAALGVTREFSGNRGGTQASQRHAWEPKPAVVPPPAWRGNARNLALEARNYLLSSRPGQEALTALERDRFLLPDTVRHAGLGLVREAQWFPKANWGIAPEPGSKPKVWVPEGLLIPTIVNREIVSLTVRRGRDCVPPYLKVSGSSAISMWLGPLGEEARAVVVVESALDAILLHQELPGDIATVALGAASNRPDAETTRRLRELRLVLVALDGDEAGAGQAIGWWETHFANASRLAYPRRYGAKDPTELAVAVGNTDILRVWVEAGIDIARSRHTVHLAQPMNGNAVRKPPVPQAAPQPASSPAREVVRVEAGPSLDMSVTLVSDTRGLEAPLARIQESDGVVGLDTETTPLPEFADTPKAALDPRKSRPRTLQVSTGDHVFVFDLNRVDIGALAPVTSRRWAGHNAVFDLKVLRAAGLDPATPECTMLLANTMCSGLVGLQKLAAEHLGVPLDKTVREGDWSGDLSPEQVQYAARDAWVTLKLCRRLAETVERRGLTRLYELLRGAQPVVATMELAGVGLDTEAHAQLVSEWGIELDGAMAQVRALLGGEFNPRSSKQVMAYLEANLDADTLRCWPKTDSGNLCTDADSLAIRADLPALAAIATARSTAHRLSQFGPSMASLGASGRLHPHLLIGAQQTGRFSCKDPSLYNVNRDPRLRSLFVAAPGRVVVSADFGMIQLRIAALVSRDDRLVSAMERGQDLHRLSASLVMGRPPADVTAEERALIKPVNFGQLFCMGPDTLWRYARSNYGVDMSIEDAQRFREAWRRSYPGITAWHSSIRDQLADCGKVRTPCGRWSALNASLPQAAAHVIQGAESEVLLAALGRLTDALRGLDAIPMLCVHDEITLDVAESDVPAAERALQLAMEQGMLDVFPTAPLVGLVEVHHGPNWHAAKHG